MKVYAKQVYNALLQIYESVSDIPTDELMRLAVEEFGTTSSLRRAGYILPNGTLLKFSDGDTRDVDHRSICVVYTENDIPIWSDEYQYNYVVDFMNHGAIRCDVNTGLIDLTQEPTKEQYFVLRQFMRMSGGEAYVDITDEVGNTIHSFYYEKAVPSRLVNDLNQYFTEGIKPLGDGEMDDSWWDGESEAEMELNPPTQTARDFPLGF